MMATIGHDCYKMLSQALLSHGVITHAQYMNFIYMKNVINNCKTEHEGSVIAEVGSGNCNSEGHVTFMTIITFTFIIVIIIITTFIITIMIRLAASTATRRAT